MAGGIGRNKPADAKIEAICQRIRKENGLEGYPLFKVIEYREQLVKGTNYFIKVQTDHDGSCIHLRVYSDLPVIDQEKMDGMDLTEEGRIEYLESQRPLELVGLEEGFNLSSYLS